jgi:hypothetical protein
MSFFCVTSFKTEQSKFNIIKSQLVFYRKIKITPDANYGNIYSVKMIGQHYLLIAIDIHLYVLKINYDSFELSVVSDIPNIFYASYTVDQTDSFSFIAYNSFNFVIGNLVENELVLSPRREFNFDNLKLTRLVNNQLIGFHIQNNQNDADVWLWQLSEINLTTLTAKTTDVPFTYNVLRDLYSTTVSFLYLFLILTHFRFPIAGLEINFMFLLLIKTQRYDKYFIIFNVDF